MINNPDWYKTKVKPYIHQFSLDCIEKIAECMEKFEKGEINADSSFEIATQILTDEIDDPEFLDFAIENLSELLSHFESGRVNIRIHRYYR